MKNKIIFIFVFIFVISTGYADRTTQLTRQLMPGVVTIYTEKGLGSGFIISKDGYIFTNAHVVTKLWDSPEDIDDPFNAVYKRITVKMNNKRVYQAKVIGYDARVDIAVLKINPEEKLEILKLGDSDNIKTGEKVIALGSPMGLEQTMTQGVISHVGRVLTAGPGWEFPINVIQTDAAINPGNSGGPMLNMSGEVIGINYASMSKWISEGVGFAIPINVAKYIKTQILEKGKVNHGYLGFSMYPVSDEFSKAMNVDRGILIDNVYKNSPAEKAELKPGDIIVSFNSKSVSAKTEREVNDIEWKITTLPIGDIVKLNVLRYTGVVKENLFFNLKVVESPMAEVELKPYVFKELGFSIKEITEVVYEKYNLGIHKGIWINNIDGDEIIAKKAGLEIGDVITKIDGKEVFTPEEFQDGLYNALKNKKTHILIQVLRKKDFLPLFLVPDYNLKDKKLLLLILDRKINKKLYNLLQLKLLVNGINTLLCGINEDPIYISTDSVEDSNKFIKPDIKIEQMQELYFDGIVLISSLKKYDFLKTEQKEVMKNTFNKILKDKKLLSAIGSGVDILLDIKPELKVKKIIFTTGNEVEVDENLVTAKEEKENYSSFVYQIINILSKF